MCKTRQELDSKVAEIRSLKALKDELESNIKALENEVIDYFKCNEVNEVIGNDYKVTYKPQSREMLDKDRLIEELGDLTDYIKTTTYSVLRIK